MPVSETRAQEDETWSIRLDAEKPAFVHRHEATRPAGDLEELLSVLKNQDVARIPTAIKELESLNDEELLMILVESGRPYEKHLAASVIGRIGSRQSLFRIINSLDRENEWILSARSDSEMNALNRKIQQDMLTAIERITGLKYDHPGNYDRRLILDFIQEVRHRGLRPDKRPDLAKKTHQNEIPQQGTELEQRERFWVEICGGGILVGLAAIWLTSRLRQTNRKGKKR